MSADYGLAMWDVLPLEQLVARPPRVLLSVGATAQSDRMLGHPVLAALQDTRCGACDIPSGCCIAAGRRSSMRSSISPTSGGRCDPVAANPQPAAARGHAGSDGAVADRGQGVDAVRCLDERRSALADHRRTAHAAHAAGGDGRRGAWGFRARRCRAICAIRSPIPGCSACPSGAALGAVISLYFGYAAIALAAAGLRADRRWCSPWRSWRCWSGARAASSCSRWQASSSPAWRDR